MTDNDKLLTPAEAKIAIKELVTAPSPSQKPLQPTRAQQLTMGQNKKET